LNVSFWPYTWNVPAPALNAWSVPLRMPELLSEVALATHAALFGGRGTLCGATLGRIGPCADRGVAALTGAALNFAGTPGADSTAAGRVTDEALGMVGFAASDVAALVVAVLVFAAPGALGAAAGCAVDVTVAVIE
jgi:hypothetical protein